MIALERTRTSSPVSDAEIAQAIRGAAVPGAFMWCSPGYVDVAVRDGDVVLTGEVESADVAEALVAAVERVPGVRSVTSRLRIPEPVRDGV
jgi:osmotically-inducible protein OsmY